MNLKHTLLVSAVSASALLAGCTAAQVQQTMQDSCVAIGAGVTLAADVSVPGLSQVLTQEITAATTDCPNFAQGVSALVADVTGGGATASVSVSATAPAASMAARRMGAARVVFHFTVTNGIATVMPSSAAMMSRLAR